jgi:hypothetical protein
MTIQKIKTGVIEDNSITTSKFLNQSVTIEKLATSGTLPALDGSALTGIVAGATITKDPNDPAVDTNPADGVGALWLNTSQAYLWVCTDATTDNNIWKSASCGNDSVAPFPSHLGGTMIMFASSEQIIAYLTIATLGNAKLFGSNSKNGGGSATGNTNRTLYINSSTSVSEISFLNPNTLGNSVIGGHGTLTLPRSSIGVCSDGTRAVIGGGDLGSFNTDSGSGDPGGGFLAATNMEFVSIQNGGTAQELGDLNIIGTQVRTLAGNKTCDRNKLRQTVGCSDGTHGYWVNGYGGFDNSNDVTNPNGAGYSFAVQKFTVQTNGNCLQFGTSIRSSTEHIVETDGNRIIRGGGLVNTVNAPNPAIEFIANASGGTASEFGSFLISRRGCSSATNGTRIVVTGNTESQNVIEYITPSTLGDAQDFGDMDSVLTINSVNSAASGGSGGLG